MLAGDRNFAVTIDSRAYPGLETSHVMCIVLYFSTRAVHVDVCGTFNVLKFDEIGERLEKKGKINLKKGCKSSYLLKLVSSEQYYECLNGSIRKVISIDLCGTVDPLILLKEAPHLW